MQLEKKYIFGIDAGGTKVAYGLFNMDGDLLDRYQHPTDIEADGPAFSDKVIVTVKEILEKTGIQATCGIGTNLYLAKVALDITAKRSDDFIGCLDEKTYQETLWDHRPLTDFWRIGRGIADRLAGVGVTTMGQLAHFDQEKLYHMFGIDAELLIDHAWGRETATISDIKAYTPKSRSLTSGQVLMKDYSFENGKLIVKEMVDMLCLDMARKNLVTDSVTLQVGYSHACHRKPARGTTSLAVETNADTVMEIGRAPV